MKIFGTAGLRAKINPDTSLLYRVRVGVKPVTEERDETLHKTVKISPLL